MRNVWFNYLLFSSSESVPLGTFRLNEAEKTQGSFPSYILINYWLWKINIMNNLWTSWKNLSVLHPILKYRLVIMQCTHLPMRIEVICCTMTSVIIQTMELFTALNECFTAEYLLKILTVLCYREIFLCYFKCLLPASRPFSFVANCILTEIPYVGNATIWAKIENLLFAWLETIYFELYFMFIGLKHVFKFEAFKAWNKFGLNFGVFPIFFNNNFLFCQDEFIFSQ